MSTRLRGVTWPSFVALTALVCMLVALSCSDSNTETNEEAERQTSAPNFVTNRNIQAREPGSPERALLEWWQAVQFADVVAVEEQTTLSAFREHRRRRAFAAIRALANALGKPQIVGKRQRGPGRAALRVYVQALASGGVVEGQSRYTFTLVRSPQGQWKVADLSYLENTYADLLRSRK